MVGACSRVTHTCEDVYSEVLEGLTLQTGDLICTTSGIPEILVGEFWRFLGRLVPGEIDHIVVYLGPDGLCVEAGPKGVNLFNFPKGRWDGQAMRSQRGPYVDTLIGIAYPMANRVLTSDEEDNIRVQVRQFCLEQARLNKPYNMNYLNPDTDDAFYCSQLPYRAYQMHGINLNTGLALPNLIGSDKIVFPQEIWASCKTVVISS